MQYAEYLQQIRLSHLSKIDVPGKSLLSPALQPKEDHDQEEEEEEEEEEDGDR